jgi:2'-5' RNA ligase
MKPFRTYLNEAEEASAEEHPGTYAKLTLDRASMTRLSLFCKEHKIPTISPEDYHVTMAFSRVHVPELADYPINLPISVHVKGYKIFPTVNKPGKNSLVVVLDSKYLHQIFKTFTEEYGASYDYDEFIPHITVTYEWPEETVPETIPHFALTLNKFVVEDLDLDKKFNNV